jgi:AraC-like DNA-binding protein
MNYREFAASPALQPYIDCFWTQEGSLAEGQIYRCIPSGNTDIIIGTSEGEEWLLCDDQWQQIPRSFVTGIWTKPAVLKVRERMEWFGIRFKPEVFLHLFNQPFREMENVTLDVRSVLGRSMGELAERIAGAGTTEQRIALAENYFAQRLKNDMPGQVYFSNALRLIRQFGGRVSTEELSKKVFVCERQLQRAFRENFGISPKTYSRLVRFNRASTLLKKPGRLNWADVTYSCGYADQAHFIRDFKAFSGSNPTALISDPLSLTTMSANAEMC